MKTAPKSKLKTYEVLITSYCTVLVKNCPSEEEALEAATYDISYGDMEMDEARIHATFPNNAAATLGADNIVDYKEWNS